ncbi:condensation domain-containing protein [Gordonia sp. (in: high G+C Gram-positive bacteria)]|uniref:condensation domain-containing protein n=1 Tax=Gordonia sp. (in: high G+C Gram-positive bacteria) TaxID=84139 RepID=UPI003C7122A6
MGGDLADLWAEVLGCDAVAPEADFFELGGHSLLATRLLAAVADRYGVTLRLRDLLGAPRLDQMADRIATQTGRGGEAPETHSELSQEAGPIASTDVPPSDGLTRVQHAYLVGRTEAFGTAAAACHSYLEFDCGDLDLDRFDAAFNAVLARHRMLRTVIRSERHREVPLPPGGFRTTRTDARGADPEAAASVWRTGLVTRTAAPDRWPLVAPHALLTDAGVRIGWSIDVLVCDASSFALLYAELGIAYRGEPLPAAPTVTFADVVARLEARTRSDAYRRSRDYWRARAATLPGPPVVWTGAPSIDAAGFDRLAITLDPGERDALRAWARSASTTESAAILTLYLRMLARWSGQRHFSVVTTSFDDRPAGVVGDFTELTVLEARVTDDAADDLRAVTTQLFEDLDHRGYSAVDVLADRGRVDGSRFTLPVVFTSTLGSDVGAGLDWAGPLVFGRSQTPQVYLDHQVYEFGGSLVLQWDHLTSVIDGADLAAAVGGLRAELAGLPGPRASSRVDIVRKAFADVLGLPVDAVGESTGFVAAGGDSVSAVRLVGALRRLLGVSVSIGAVVDGATPLDLAAMDADAPTGAGTVDLVRADDAQQVMDLLPLQQAYWVGQSGAWDLSYQSAHFYVDFHDPETDPDRLRQAVARLIAHQPMLRAEVTPDGRQRILDLDDPRLDATPVEIVDLTDADADGCARAIAATRAEWERTGPDPQVWPAFDVRAHLLPGGGARIHVRCSLVFVDGWSFYLFFAELLAFHDDPNTVLPTPDVSFADYVASVAAARRTPAWQADLAWWRSRLDDLPPAPALPRARAADAAESGEPAELMVRRTLRLDTADTGRLRARCAAQSVTMTAVVGAAYARALAEWSGQARFLLTMLFFNRLPVHDEIEQVLGPFASSTFLDVSADHRNVAGLVRGFGGAIGAVLDHALVSGVELGRELTRRTGRPAVIAPVVFTSTLGFSNAARDAATSRIDPADVYERVRTPQVLIDCQAAEENGSLVCNVDAAGGVFAAEELDALVARIGEFLEAVIVDDDAFAAELAPIEAPAADRPTAVVDVAHRTVRRKPSPSASIPETVREAWVAATGASEFGREDDFFTAGGDSLGMIRMLRAVGAAVGADIEPAAFLADPTPATLARLLPATVGPQLDQSLLVRLADGPGTPLYLIHPSGGDVLCYSGLARAVTDRPVIAVNDPELTGAVDDPVALGTIPALAAAYADAIATHCGAGDVVIGGWSMGGTLAHEVATILASDPGPAAVRPVGVVLIDSNVPDRIRALPGDSDRDRSTAAAVRYLGSLEAFLGLDLRSGTSSTTAALAGAPPGDHAAVVADLLADAGLPTTDVERRLDVFTRHLTGLGDHRASPFRAAPVLVLRALEPAPRNSGVGMGVDDVGDRPDLGWADHCADLRCRDVAAHHYSILDRPAVDEVAAHINEFCTETAKGEDR